MNFLKWIRRNASILIALILVLLTILPEDYDLPRFYLTLALFFLVLKALSDIRALLLQLLIEVRQAPPTLAERTDDDGLLS